MSAAKTERQVNLVLALLSTRRFLTHSQVRRAVTNYDRGDGSDEAFRRMFERDLAELRELGVPIETGYSDDADTDPGYRIARRDYELPDITLDPAEASALGLAARLWQHGLAGAADSALAKLAAAGVEVDTSGLHGLRIPVDAAEPALAPLLSALEDARAVTFDYRRAGEPVATRRVHPWQVASWHGRWYLVGLDTDRGQPRVFRLSRVVGPVEPIGRTGVVSIPAGTDVRAILESVDTARQRHVAVLRLAAGSGLQLRRRARRTEHLEDGADLVEVEYDRHDTLLRQVLELGPAVIVTEPAELRVAVVQRLSRLADAGAP